MIPSAVCLPSRCNLFNMFVWCRVSRLYTFFGRVSTIQDWQTPEQTMISAHLCDDFVIEYYKYWQHCRRTTSR